MQLVFNSIPLELIDIEKFFPNKENLKRTPNYLKLMLYEARCSNIFICVVRNSKGIEYIYVSYTQRINGIPQRFNIVSLGKTEDVEKTFGYDIEKLRENLKSRNFDTLKLIAKQYKEQKKCNYQRTSQSAFQIFYGNLLINDFFDTFELYKIFNDEKNYKIRYLVYMLITIQLIEPCSKRQFSFKSLYYLLSNRRFHSTYIHRALKIIESKKEQIIKHLSKKLKDLDILDPEKQHTIYLDVTNFFTEKSKETKLAKRGHSKENRTTPIYQMALFMTDKLIPLAMYVYPGNMPDCKIFKPAVTQFMEHTGIKKFTIIADKAFNTAENVHFISQHADMHYIFSAKCKGTRTAPEIRDHIQEKSPWNAQESMSQKDEFTRSSFVRERDVLGEKVKEKVVCEWSHNKAQKEIEQRNACLERNQDMTTKQLYNKYTINLGTKYFDTEIQDRKGEKIANAKVVKTLNQDKIEQDRLRDGINVYLSDLTDLSDEEMAQKYRKQADIEKSFSILKSELKTRPFYLHDDKCIIAHILICFLALFFIQIVNYATGKEVTADQLQKALKNLTGIGNGRSFIDVHTYNSSTEITLRKLGFEIKEQIKHPTIKLNIITMFATGWTKALLKIPFKKIEK